VIRTKKFSCSKKATRSLAQIQRGLESIPSRPFVFNPSTLVKKNVKNRRELDEENSVGAQSVLVLSVCLERLIAWHTCLRGDWLEKRLRWKVVQRITKRKAEQELPNRVTFAHACELLAQVKTSSFFRLLQQKLKRVEFWLSDVNCFKKSWEFWLVVRRLLSRLWSTTGEIRLVSGTT
jgi:hypothetical protein